MFKTKKKPLKIFRHMYSMGKICNFKTYKFLAGTLLENLEHLLKC